MPRNEQVRGLAVPADPRAVGGLSVHEMVLIGNHDRAPSAPAQLHRDGLESGRESTVGVVDDVASNPPVWTWRPGFGRRCGPVGSGTDDERLHLGQRSSGIGRSVRLAVGELHTTVEALRPALLEIMPGALERTRVGDAHCDESGGDANGPQLLDIAGRWSRAYPHHHIHGRRGTAPGHIWWGGLQHAGTASEASLRAERM